MRKKSSLSRIMNRQHSGEAIMDSLMHISSKTISSVGFLSARHSRFFLCTGGLILADVIYLHLKKNQMRKVCGGLGERWKARLMSEAGQVSYKKRRFKVTSSEAFIPYIQPTPRSHKPRPCLLFLFSAKRVLILWVSTQNGLWASKRSLHGRNCSTNCSGWVLEKKKKGYTSHLDVEF